MTFFSTFEASNTKSLIFLKGKCVKGRSPQARKETSNEMDSELTIMSVIVSPVGSNPGTAGCLL